MRSFVLVCLIAVVSARAALYFLYAALKLPLPIETFHLEAKMVHHAWRVEHGLSLYPPWKDFPYIPNFFGPLYFLLVGGLGKWTEANIEGLFGIGRAVSFGAGLLTSILLGMLLGRVYGRSWGLLGGLVSLGSIPMIGFSVMVRADMLAELFGFAGWACAVALGGPAALGAGLLLTLAVLTKQTTGIYLVAALAALAVERRWRRGLVVGAVAAAVLGIVTVLAMLGPEPNFLASMLGESAAPFTQEQWRRTVFRLAKNAPDLLVLPLFGIPIAWRGSRRERAWGVAAIVLMAGLLAAAAKVGADQNYFLGFRILEGWALVLIARGIPDPTTSRWRRWRRPAVMLIAVACLIPGVRTIAREAEIAWRESTFTASPFGKGFLEDYRRFYALASNPKHRMLTDSGLIALRQGERAPFVDPWLFRLQVTTGQIRPEALAQALGREEFETLILTSELFSPVYDAYDFGLPPELYRIARRHYRLTGSRAGLFLYVPRREANR